MGIHPFCTGKILVRAVMLCAQLPLGAQWLQLTTSPTTHGWNAGPESKRCKVPAVKHSEQNALQRSAEQHEHSAQKISTICDTTCTESTCSLLGKADQHPEHVHQKAQSGIWETTCMAFQRALLNNQTNSRTYSQFAWDWQYVVAVGSNLRLTKSRPIWGSTCESACITNLSALLHNVSICTTIITTRTS